MDLSEYIDIHSMCADNVSIQHITIIGDYNTIATNTARSNKITPV